MRDFGLAGPRAVPPSARADAAASSPSPLCRPPCSAAPASRLLLPPFGFQRSGRRQQFGFSKYNLWHSCDRGSYPGISAAPPIPAGVVSRYPPPPSPPTAALFFCLRPLFPLGLISCAYPHPPQPAIRASFALSPRVSWSSGVFRK